MSSRTHHLRRDPRRNGNNEKLPPPPSPPRERPGAAAPSPLTPPAGNTPPPPAPRPPSAARSPAEPTHVPARSSRALRLPARPTHQLLPQPGIPLAAARPRLRYKPPRPPAPPHNMASLGFRNGAREIQQGPLNIHERLKGSRLGRRSGEGGKERASEGAEAQDGDVHGAGRPAARGEGAPPRAGLEGASCPSPGRPAPPPGALRGVDAAPGQRPDVDGAASFSSFRLLVLFCPCLGPPITPPWLGFGLKSSALCDCLQFLHPSHLVDIVIRHSALELHLNFGPLPPHSTNTYHPGRVNLQDLIIPGKMTFYSRSILLDVGFIYSSDRDRESESRNTSRGSNFR
ncbi:basic proline-rich protein-like [Zalophus californianus]|uniref:Basic proline-rich protein-like n=1 Tax=Zalophus californianus TaxID=9704 RepID=A0A6J2EQ78_ZALCA|nr:basic proline-rich protein-like [Zalophus californianus]